MTYPESILLNKRKLHSGDPKNTIDTDYFHIMDHIGAQSILEDKSNRIFKTPADRLHLIGKPIRLGECQVEY